MVSRTPTPSPALPVRCPLSPRKRTSSARLLRSDKWPDADMSQACAAGIKTAQHPTWELLTRSHSQSKVNNIPPKLDWPHEKLCQDCSRYNANNYVFRRR